MTSSAAHRRRDRAPSLGALGAVALVAAGCGQAASRDASAPEASPDAAPFATDVPWPDRAAADATAARADAAEDGATPHLDAAVTEACAPRTPIATTTHDDAFVLHRATAANGSPAYDYGPTVMFDGAYRMWWCGYDPAGEHSDHILYAETDAAGFAANQWHARGSTTPDTFDDVFRERWGQNVFDARDTCDPSVLRVHGRYYMYYGGLPTLATYVPPGARAPAPIGTFIGLAESDDGLVWTRANAGDPIIGPYDRAMADTRRDYGAGEPSVVYRLDPDGVGRFYMVYFDSTGPGGNAGNNSYIVRSADPSFQSGVQILVPPMNSAGAYDTTRSARVWIARATAPLGGWVALTGAGWDWQYSDALDQWILTSGTIVRVVRGDLTDLTPVVPDYVATFTARRDHAGLMRRYDGHAVPTDDATFAAADCGTIVLQDFCAHTTTVPAGTPAASTIYYTDLARATITLTTGASCACWNLPGVFEGAGLARDTRTLAFVVGGRRLGFGSLATLDGVAPARYNLEAGLYDALPALDRTIPTGLAGWQRGDGSAAGWVGEPALRAVVGASGAVDQKWVVSCAALLATNGSARLPVSQSTWDTIPSVGTLWCTR